MNIQTLPRQDTIIKRCFVPKLDAYLFFDYHNVELRILGYYLAVACKDYSLVDEFAAGDDIHKITASRIFGKPVDEVTDDERQKGKVLGFALLYGGGVPTLMRQGIVDSYPEGKKLIASYHAARPGIRVLSDRLIKSYESKGYITTPWGSRLHPQSDHKALNVLVQSCAADLMRHGFRNIYRYLTNASFKSHLVNVIHDEFMLDCARGELYTLVENIPTLMKYDRIEAVLPIETAIEVSFTNWGEKKQWLGEMK